MLSIEILSSKIWKIRPYSDNAVSVEFNWDQLDFNGRGTKHQREYFKDSIRSLFQAVIEDLETGVGQLSPGTVANKRRRIWALATWMAARDIWRFNQLTELDIVDFIQESIDRHQGRKGSYRSKSITTHIVTFKEIWKARDRYPGGICIDPERSREILALENQGSECESWPPVPLEVAQPLIRDAIEWMENEALVLHKLLLDIQHRVGSAVGQSSMAMKRKTERVYKEISAMDDYKKLASALSLDADDVVTVLRRASKLTDGAVLILILFLTGVRISEARSLKADCVTEIVHDTGHSYKYINGIAAKKKGGNRRWVAPDVVVDAIKRLDDKNEAVGGNISEAFIFRTFAGNGARARPGTKLSLMSHTVMCRNLLSFAQSLHRSNPFAGHIHPHQGRKTFAKFVMCRDKRALGALVQHYGHLHGAVLDGAYVGSDIKLEEILNEENRADLSRGLTDLLSTRQIGGKGAKSISDAYERIQSKVNFEGRTSIGVIVDKMISQGVKLAPCDWGYCLYQQDMAACRGGSSGPDPVNRCPSTCASCKNFVVTEKYRSWWEDRYTREENFLARGDLPEQTRVLVQVRLDETTSLLKTFNQAVTTSPVKTSEKN